jgi:hypothetical protein
MKVFDNYALQYIATSPLTGSEFIKKVETIDVLPNAVELNPGVGIHKEGRTSKVLPNAIE